MKTSLYYYGCGPRDIGHYWHSVDGKMYPRDAKLLREALPWSIGKEDGGFCPAGPQHQGVFSLIHLKGWTVVSWWDRSMDTRPGSNSTFATHAVLSASEMLAYAKREYPWVFSRMCFELRPEFT